MLEYIEDGLCHKQLYPCHKVLQSLCNVCIYILRKVKSNVSCLWSLMKASCAILVSFVMVSKLECLFLCESFFDHVLGVLAGELSSIVLCWGGGRISYIIVDQFSGCDCEELIHFSRY